MPAPVVKLSALLDELDALRRRHRAYADGIAKAIGPRAQRESGEPARSDADEISALRARVAELEARPRAFEPWELHASLEVVELLRDVAAKGECSAACADEHDPECRPRRATSILAALDARPPPVEPAR